jgi:hypothetical protein
MIDAFLFFFCSFTLLSFSISLFDGYVFFSIIWFFSIFFSCFISEAALVDFVRAAWFVFTVGMLAGRLVFASCVSKINALKIVTDPNPNPGSSFHGAKFQIKANIAFAFILLFSAVLFFALTGIGGNVDFADNVNAGSKSLLPYAVRGILGVLTSYWTWSVILAKPCFNLSSYKRFANCLLFLPTLADLILSLQFLAFLGTYGTKLVVPFTTYISFRMFYSYTWSRMRYQLRTFKLNKALLAIAFLTAFAVSFLILIFNYLGISFVDLLLLKSLGRADSYPLLDSSSISNLVQVYGGNFMYFFHPFLKAVGLKAYDMPMGSWLASGGSNINQIGGPNIHLPVVLYVLGRGGLSGMMCNLLGGIVISLLLLYARNNIVNRMNGSSLFPIFWSIFIYFNFLLLLQEPSAFGHSLLFWTIVYTVLRLAKPSLLRCEKEIP